MASSAAKTVEDYLAELPPERRQVVAAVRNLVNRHLPEGYREAMAFGMIGWAVPLSTYPNTYNKQPLCYASLAAQKNYYTLYLMSVYSDSKEEKALRKAYDKAGKKLDMGKCCLRFKALDDLLQPQIGELIAATPVSRFVALYEASRKKK